MEYYSFNYNNKLLTNLDEYCTDLFKTNYNTDIFINILFQILYSLLCTNLCGYTNLDLKTHNIFLKELDSVAIHNNCNKYSYNSSDYFVNIIQCQIKIGDIMYTTDKTYRYLDMIEILILLYHNAFLEKHKNWQLYMNIIWYLFNLISNITIDKFYELFNIFIAQLTQQTTSLINFIHEKYNNNKMLNFYNVENILENKYFKKFKQNKTSIYEYFWINKKKIEYIWTNRCITSITDQQINKTICDDIIIKMNKINEELTKTFPNFKNKFEKCKKNLKTYEIKYGPTEKKIIQIWNQEQNWFVIPEQVQTNQKQQLQTNKQQIKQLPLTFQQPQINKQIIQQIIQQPQFQQPQIKQLPLIFQQQQVIPIQQIKQQQQLTFQQPQIKQLTFQQQQVIPTQQIKQQPQYKKFKIIQTILPTANEWIKHEITILK